MSKSETPDSTNQTKSGGEMKTKFMKKLENVKKAVNSFYIESQKRYEEIIKEVKDAKKIVRKQQ